MRIPIVAVTAVLVSLAAASTASAKPPGWEAPTGRGNASAPTWAPTGGGGSSAPLMPAGGGGAAPLLSTSGKPPAGAPGFAPPSLDEELRQRQEFEARIMEMLRQAQAARDAAIRRGFGG